MLPILWTLLCQDSSDSSELSIDSYGSSYRTGGVQAKYEGRLDTPAWVPLLQGPWGEQLCPHATISYKQPLYFSIGSRHKQVRSGCSLRWYREKEENLTDHVPFGIAVSFVICILFPLYQI